MASIEVDCNLRKLAQFFSGLSPGVLESSLKPLNYGLFSLQRFTFDIFLLVFYKRFMLTKVQSKL